VSLPPNLERRIFWVVAGFCWIDYVLLGRRIDSGSA